jgi:uncharacterized membrane protein
MAELVVVGFKDNIHRASGVLDELRVLDDKWILELRDAVAVHRDLDGALKMDQSYQPTGRQGAGWGSALGLLIGATLAIPFTAGTSAAVAAGAMAAAALSGATMGATVAGLDALLWKDTFGISNDFIREVSKLLTPGSSAIYAILETTDSSIVVGHFQAYGGMIQRTTLSKTQQAEIEKFLRSAQH